MKILVNGTEKKIQAETIQALIPALGLIPETSLVEHNGIALHRNEWKDHTLSEGDKIEILQISAGG